MFSTVGDMLNCVQFESVKNHAFIPYDNVLLLICMLDFILRIPSYVSQIYKVQIYFHDIILDRHTDTYYEHTKHKFACPTLYWVCLAICDKHEI